MTYSDPYDFKYQLRITCQGGLSLHDVDSSFLFYVYIPHIEKIERKKDVLFSLLLVHSVLTDH